MNVIRRPQLAGLLLPLAAAALVVYLALVPLGYLLWHAFTDGGSPTFEHFREAFGRAGLGPMTVSSLAFAAGSAAVAVGCGTAVAFLVARTDLPMPRLTLVVAVIPLIVPGVLYTIAWIFLASPRIGTLDGVLPLDVFGMGGMILVEGIHLAPLVLLLVIAALRSMDGSLEEAAFMSGASRLTVVRRITLPLARPALYAALLVMSIRALESFEVPALLGIPEGTWVFTSRIWHALDSFPSNEERAAAYSVPLLAITLVAVLLYTRLARRGAHYQTVAGRRSRPARIPLGRWRWPIAAGVWGYLLLTVVAPLAILLYASTQPRFSSPTLDGLERMTGEHYSAILSDDLIRQAFGNSLLLGVGAATAVTLVMAAVAWLIVRGRFRGRWLLDGVASLPLVVPGLILGISLLFLYVRFPVPIYGTLWILFIAYFTRFMPYGLRAAAAALDQVSGEVEEAARTSGATWSQTFRRILLPLIVPGLLAGWLYVVITSMRELSSAILLSAPDTEVLPVRIFILYEGGDFAGLAALGVVITVLLGGLAALAWRLGGRYAGWAR